MLPNYEGTPFFIGVQKRLQPESSSYCLLYWSSQCNSDTSTIAQILLSSSVKTILANKAEDFTVQQRFTGCSGNRALCYAQQSGPAMGGWEDRSADRQTDRQRETDI
jgi:hypothetical protein